MVASTQLPNNPAKKEPIWGIDHSWQATYQSETKQTCHCTTFPDFSYASCAISRKTPQGQQNANKNKVVTSYPLPHSTMDDGMRVARMTDKVDGMAVQTAATFAPATKRNRVWWMAQVFVRRGQYAKHLSPSTREALLIGMTADLTVAM